MCSSEARFVNCEQSLVVSIDIIIAFPRIWKKLLRFRHIHVVSYNKEMQRTDGSNEVKNEHGNKRRDLVYVSHRSISFSVNNGALYVVYIQCVVVFSIRIKFPLRFSASYTILNLQLYQPYTLHTHTLSACVSVF